MTKRFTLTDDMALVAVHKNRGNYTIFIADTIRQLHARHVASGGTGYVPMTSRVLHHLKRLESQGFLLRGEQSSSAYYSYHWQLTPKGLEHIARIETADEPREI